MCEHGNVRIVPTPAWLWSSRTNPLTGIQLDNCIAEEILNAWEHGVKTLGSCCGHGKQQKNVVLEQGEYHREMARLYLPGFTLLQWQLIDVTI